MTIEWTPAGLNRIREKSLATLDLSYYHDMGQVVQDFYRQGSTHPVWSGERAEWHYRSFLLWIAVFAQPPLPTPSFHFDWIRWMTSEPTYVNMTAREHGKTQLHSIFRPAWELGCDRTLRFFLVSSKISVARDNLVAIKSFMATPRYIAGFGLMNPEEVPDHERVVSTVDWSKYSITVNRDERDQPIRGPSVTVAGTLTRVLSTRADRLIMDDIIDRQMAFSSTVMDKIDDWVNDDLLPVLIPESKGGQEIIVGTPYTLSDIYHRKEALSRPLDIPPSLTAPVGRGASGRVYRVFRGDAIVNVTTHTTLWPEMWSWEDLSAQRIKMGTARFNRNYRCLVVSDEDSPFPMVWFNGGTGSDGTSYPGCYEPALRLGQVPSDVRLIVIGIDPAIGEGSGSKHFGAIALGLTHEDLIRVIDIERRQMGFTVQRRFVLDWNRRFRPRAIAVEDNSYQRALRQSIEANHRIPIFGFYTNRNKISPDTGVLAMDVHFEFGRVRLPRGDTRTRELVDLLVEELHFWKRINHSDLAMAFWIALRRLMVYAPELRTLPDATSVIRENHQRYNAMPMMTVTGMSLPRGAVSRVRRLAEGLPDPLSGLRDPFRGPTGLSSSPPSAAPYRIARISDPTLEDVPALNSRTDEQQQQRAARMEQENV